MTFHSRPHGAVDSMLVWVELVFHHFLDPYLGISFRNAADYNLFFNNNHLVVQPKEHG